jgi:restriction-modification enzyme MmeI-like protein
MHDDIERNVHHTRFYRQVARRSPDRTRRGAIAFHRPLPRPRRARPTDADPTGAFYAFERGATKTSGGEGWADVWLRGHFAWEYKKKHADLRAAYRQLRQYVEALDNPPLLVVCDLDRFQIRTNFTGTATKLYAFSLDDLDQPDTIRILKALWTDPNALRPEETPEAITQAAAERFGRLAASLNARGRAAPSGALLGAVVVLPLR